MVFKENSHRNMEKTLHLFLMKFFVPYRWYNLFLVCEQEDFFCVLAGLRSLGFCGLGVLSLGAAGASGTCSKTSHESHRHGFRAT